MPRLILSSEEKATLEEYINFITHNSSPCESCGWRSRMECGGCPSENEYRKNLKKYDVADLLKHKEIKEYVDTFIKLNNCRTKIQLLTNDVRVLEKKISEILDEIDLDTKHIRFECHNAYCSAEFSVQVSECVKFDDIDGTTVYAKSCPVCGCLCKTPVDSFSND